MILLGITGGIGMGKSTVGRLMVEAGLDKVVDSDDIARELTKPGSPVLEEIQKTFGNEYFNPDGTLNRSALAELVFNNETERKKLEAILHPKIRARWLDMVKQWRSENIKCGAVVVPLLFETKAQDNFDAIISVACSSQTQRNRLLSKGWSQRQIEARIKAQLPVEEKMALADYVIWNESGLDITREQLFRILKSLGVLILPDKTR
ncbi:MAG: dephospho-CoA kinase [Verrucomicrobiia bacterium]